MTAQRDLVFPGGSGRDDAVEQASPCVRTGICQIGESAPHLGQLQRRSASESPQGTLLGRHGVRIGDVLGAAGDQPDGRPQLGGDRGTEEPPRSGQDMVLHPQQ